MIYLDTGCFVKLYYPEPDSAKVIALIQGKPVRHTNKSSPHSPVNHSPVTGRNIGRGMFDRGIRARRKTRRISNTENRKAGNQFVVSGRPDFKILLFYAGVVAGTSSICAFAWSRSTTFSFMSWS